MAKEKDKGTRAYDLEERLIEFAIRVLDLVEASPRTRVGNHIALVFALARKNQN